MIAEQATRYDTFRIPKVQKTKEGYLRGDAVGSRAGVFVYYNLDGSVRRELRHPDDIFTKASLDTLKMIPVTLDHPSEFVNSENATYLQKGYTGETIQVQDGKIITSLTITSQDAIDDILKGKCVELSYGYEVTLVKEDGVYNGEKYDYRQTNPVYNHLALVAEGRAGHDARVRFDNQSSKAIFECRFDENKSINNKEVNMSDNKTENKVENNDSA